MKAFKHAKIKTVSLLTAVGVSAAGLIVAAIFPALASAQQQNVVYNNIPNSMPGNVPSVGFEATSTREFGSQVSLADSARQNPQVTVLMSSWACKSGSWNNDNCITNPGSTFTHPVTINVYNANSDDSVGSLIRSDTQTFTMPYRPTADDGTNCNAANNAVGEWWDGTKCDNGKAFPISFNLNGTTLPDDVIITVAYNTSDYGTAPLGDATACHSTPQGCPYDSLNVGTNPTPSVGNSEPDNNSAYVNGSNDGSYCDNGVGGLNTLRLDEGCWTGFLPAIKVAAVGNNGHDHRGDHHKHHDHDGDDNHHNENQDRNNGFFDLNHS